MQSAPAPFGVGALRVVLGSGLETRRVPARITFNHANAGKSPGRSPGYKQPLRSLARGFGF